MASHTSFMMPATVVTHAITEDDGLKRIPSRKIPPRNAELLRRRDGFTAEALFADAWTNFS